MKNKKDEGIKCKVCGDIIPPKRIEILGPHTNTCVKHSTAGKKVGVPITYGTGEDIYVELDVMEEEDFKKFERLQKSGTTRNPSSLAD
jgi:hypothetical protein